MYSCFKSVIGECQRVVGQTANTTTTTTTTTTNNNNNNHHHHHSSDLQSANVSDFSGAGGQ